MKQTIFIPLLALVIPVQAQGIFNQQASKRKVIMEQIVGLEIYARALEKGYNITKDGLSGAHDLKNGTFELHADYIQSLSQVNPAVTSNPKVKAITALQQQIIRVFDAEADWQKKQQALSAAELSNLQKVYVNLLAAGRSDLQELELVITPGKLQLTDEQRLERIDKLYADMADRYNFACTYTRQCRQVATRRIREQQENGQLKQLYGIH